MMTRQRPRHGCRFVDHRRAHWLHLDRVAGAVCEEDVQLIAFARDMRHTPLHQSRRPPPGCDTVSARFAALISTLMWRAGALRQRASGHPRQPEGGGGGSQGRV